MEDDYNIIVRGKISPVPQEGEYRSFRLFFHDTEAVAHDTYMYRLYPGYTNISWREVDANGYFSINFTPFDISYDFPYDHIDTYYARAYGCNYWDGGYPDLATGLYIYPSLNKEGSSNVATLFFPD